jgi:hypothetical protein
VFASARVGQATVTIPAGESAAVQIPLTSLSSLEGNLVAQLPDDELGADNRRWLILPEQKPIDVLLVSGRLRTADRRGATDFVQLALTPIRGSRTPGITTTVVDAADLAATDLSRFRCLYLCNVPAIDDAAAARLKSYVEAGGGLEGDAGVADGQVRRRDLRERRQESARHALAHGLGSEASGDGPDRHGAAGRR